MRAALLAVSLNGALLWMGMGCSSTEPTGSPPRVLWSNTSTSSASLSLQTVGDVDDSHFYAVRGLSGTSRTFAAFDRATGRTAWTAQVVEPCQPVSVAGRVYCPASQLYAFDGTDGRPLWTATIDATLQLVQGTADGERAYAGSNLFGQPTEAFAADASTGQMLWRRSFTGDGWTGARLRSLTLSPEGDLLAAVVGQFGLNGAGGEVATVVALDPATGAERWRYQDGGPGTFGGIGGMTIWDDLVLYNDTYGFAATAFSRTTRDVVWRAPWTPSYAGTTRPPLVADGTAYFADGNGTTFAVDARTGALRWRTDRDGNARSLEVCGPVVLMNNGPVKVLDRATGRPRGRLLADDDTAGQTAVADGVVYVSATSGVYAFDCTS